MTDDTIHAAVLSTAPKGCVPAGGGQAPADTLAFFGEMLGGILTARFVLQTGHLEWQQGVVPIKSLPNGIFGWDGGWGMFGGSIAILKSPSATTPMVVDTNLVPSYSASGQGSMVIWPGWVPNVGATIIKRYTDDDGVKVLVDQGAGIDIHEVALSDERIVWIGTHGPQTGEGKYESAEIYWAARTPDPGKIKIVQGPSLPADTDLLQLKTWGDYAVTSGCLGEQCRLLVVQLSTGKLWPVFNRPGSGFNKIIGVTPTEILLSEIDWPSGDPAAMQRIVRLDLSQLDALSTMWGSP